MFWLLRLAQVTFVAKGKVEVVAVLVRAVPVSILAFHPLFRTWNRRQSCASIRDDFVRVSTRRPRSAARVALSTESKVQIFAGVIRTYPVAFFSLYVVVLAGGSLRGHPTITDSIIVRKST
jgi:hypothetical protein